MPKVPTPQDAPKFTVYRRQHLDSLEILKQALTPDQILSMKAVSAVLPFRVNQYVLDELIDWSAVPEDPIFQLTFPQEGMLAKEDHDHMVDLVRSDADKATVEAAARVIQHKLNPHPAGQMDLNVPLQDGEPMSGMQHKYRETVLFFPSQGQTCHAYCTYCFRWAQFVGLEDLKFASKEAESLAAYARSHPEVSSILFTGGDPLVMRTELLRRYIKPLLEIESVRSIRLGTKSVAYWPYRFTHGADADDLMRLFDEVTNAGKSLAVMGHYSHPRELAPQVAQDAVRRITRTGAVVRCQAPLIRHVNDDVDAWATMWREQVRLGAIPYYMFVERDTGAKHYFQVPLARALDVFQGAIRQVSGLARTVRGPSMSATPGKVMVDGVAHVGGEKVFVLKFLQGRDPQWANRVFFAKYDESAGWLNELTPAFGESEFFFEAPMRHIMEKGNDAAWAAPKSAPRRPRVSGTLGATPVFAN